MLSFIKNLLAIQDPLQNAFDNFYRELLASHSYKEYLFEINGLDHPCYNLLSKEDIEYLCDWIKIREGEVLDHACGTGLVATLKSDNAHLSGYDFSKTSINYCRKHFPKELWSLQRPTHSFDHLVSIDGLYHMKNKETWFKKALSKTKSSAFIINNFTQGERYPQVSGWKLQMINTTENFHSLLEKITHELSKEYIIADRKSFPTLWKTLEKEAQKHLQQMESTERIIALYEKHTQ